MKENSADNIQLDTKGRGCVGAAFPLCVCTLPERERYASDRTLFAGEHRGAQLAAHPAIKT